MSSIQTGATKVVYWKINILKENSIILKIGVMASCQKLGILLVIEFQKMTLSKNVNSKKYAPKLLLSNEKKNRMNEWDSNDFWHN